MNPNEQLEARTRFAEERISAAAQVLPLSDLALCAVGSFGRRELFPYSDIDLLIVTAGESRLAVLEQPLAEFLRILWDDGLRVSHSVRTIAECTAMRPAHLEVLISLLDLRFVTGEAALTDRLLAQLKPALARFGHSIAQQLSDSAMERHARFHDTVYHMEPNVKETNGGLRDLHTLHWLARLKPDLPPPDEKSGAIEAARDFLWLQRLFLHLENRRDSNLLTFEMQDRSAAQLPPQPVRPEAWMRQYFGHTRTIYRATLQAIDAVKHKEGFARSTIRQWRKLLLPTEPEPIPLTAPRILELFTASGRTGTRLPGEIESRLAVLAPGVSDSFLRDGTLWPEWLKLMSQPKAGFALTQMAQTGILARALPVWSAIDSLVVRDFYHRYTVDEHTLTALRELDSLLDPSNPAPARISRLAEEEDKLSLVRFALLLHDVGKGTRPGDHVIGSGVEAQVFLHRLGCPDHEAADILFLIGHHLELSTLMTGRDLDDPATAGLLTANVPTQEHLRRLTLFTWADVSAVHPGAMTPWRFEQLWRVYLLGTRQFTRELVSGRLRSVAPGLESLEFVQGFPQRYLRTHSAAEVEHHCALASLIDRDGISAELRPESGNWLLTVLAPDKPRLFATICGVLAANGMNILKGEAMSNSAGIILDLVRFADPMQTLELNPEEREKLTADLRGAVLGSLSVPHMLGRRRPPWQLPVSSALRPTILFLRDESDIATLLEFSGEDRPGLLYDLASAISESGCDIEVVMIDTQSHKANDVFYLTKDGAKLDSDTEVRLREALLKATG